MTCGVCGTNSHKRVISGIPMCEECFSRIASLRNKDKATVSFFSNEQNLTNASREARAYIRNIYISNILDPEQVALEEKKFAQVEHEKQQYAKMVTGLYEYDVVTIVNKGHGRVNKEEMLQVLSSRAREGWKLHTIYSNELGKNALAIMGFGLNETACEDVLIFERKLSDQ